MFYDFIKIHGYDGTIPALIDPGMFEVFQGSTGSVGSSDGDGFPEININMPVLDFEPTDNLILKVEDTFNDYIAQIESYSTAGVPAPIPGNNFLAIIMKFMVKFLPLLPQIPVLKVIAILTIIQKVVEILKTLNDIRLSNPLNRIADILDTALIETYGGIDRSILNERLKEIRDAIEAGDPGQIIVKLQDLVDLLKKALLETVGLEEQSILKNYLAKINAAIEALQYNDEVLDFGFLRVLLKGKVIEY